MNYLAKKLSKTILFVALPTMFLAVFILLQPNSTQATGEAGYWHFDENTGTTVNDSSGNNNGILINGPVWTTGKVGGALSFDGIDDYINAGNNSSLNITDTITIEMWIYGSSYPSGKSLLSRANYNSFGYDIYIGFTGLGNLCFRSHQAGAMQSQCSIGSVLTNNAWNHIAFAKSGSVGIWYINGIDKTAAHVDLTNMAGGSRNLIIGRYDGGGANFAGSIDEVKIYSRALNPSEILADYNAGFTLTPTPTPIFTPSPVPTPMSYFESFDTSTFVQASTHGPITGAAGFVGESWVTIPKGDTALSINWSSENDINHQYYLLYNKTIYSASFYVLPKEGKQTRLTIGQNHGGAMDNITLVFHSFGPDGISLMGGEYFYDASRPMEKKYYVPRISRTEETLIELTVDYVVDASFPSGYRADLFVKINGILYTHSAQARDTTPIQMFYYFNSGASNSSLIINDINLSSTMIPLVGTAPIDPPGYEPAYPVSRRLWNSDNINLSTWGDLTPLIRPAPYGFARDKNLTWMAPILYNSISYPGRDSDTDKSYPVLNDNSTEFNKYIIVDWQSGVYTSNPLYADGNFNITQFVELVQYWANKSLNSTKIKGIIFDDSTGVKPTHQVVSMADYMKRIYEAKQLINPEFKIYYEWYLDGVTDFTYIEDYSKQYYDGLVVYPRWKPVTASHTYEILKRTYTDTGKKVILGYYVAGTSSLPQMYGRDALEAATITRQAIIAESEQIAGITFYGFYGQTLTTRGQAVTDEINRYKNLSVISIPTPTPTPTPTPSPSDSTPPSITNLQTSGITTAGATISWTTSEPATDQLNYGLSASYGQLTTKNTALSTSHTITLSNLSSGNAYHYQAISEDAATNQTTSIDQTFTTLASITPDTVPPNQITNLSSSAITQTSVSLSWTAPGDDNNIGVASSYDIRYSTQPITESNWAQATPATGEPTPQAAGTTQSQYISVGLSPDTTYYFAIKSQDEVPNISSLSNILQIKTLAVTVAPSSGGGGGSYSDTTPPSQPQNFKAAPAEKQITLSWTNPTDSDFVRVVILRKENFAPASKTDGAIIYEGTGQTITDINLDNTKTYYYSIFAYDARPNYSQALSISAKPQAGLTSTSSTSSTYPDSTLLKTLASPKVYVIINQKKKWISTPEVFETLGYKWAAITITTDSTLKSIADYEDNLIRANGDIKVWLVTNGIRHHVPNPEIFLDYGFSWTDVKDVPQSTIDQYQLARLIRESHQGTIYYLSPQAIKKWIPNPEIFSSYNNRWEDIQVISKKEMDSYPVSNLMSYNNQVFLIQGTTKRLIPNETILNKYDSSLILGANQKEFDWFKLGATVK